jgi:hypothetical protein
MEHAQTSPEAALPVLTDENLETLIDALRRDPEALAEVISRAGPDSGRSDGWTPFARRFFLQTLAETGRVTEACRWAQLSKQSAYALRARDPVFAAGWDAACEIARTQLADALFEKAIDGVTETIVKDGEIVAERHRFDSRLSIAVLHRLDKRCDRSVELGSEHLALVRNWEEFLTHIGRGEERSAEALLQTAQHGQFGQLPLGENPTGDEDEPTEIDLSERCWKEEDGWMTDFPPPPGFNGYEKREYGSFGYERACTPEEAEILEADEAAVESQQLADEEALRDAWFRMLSESQQPET